MKYYMHSVVMLFKAATQYRASFLMQVCAQFVMTAGELMAVTVLLNRFGTLGQWSAGEILFFFGMMQLVFALVECMGRGITNFQGMIGSGEFDTVMLRPRPLLAQVICMRLDPRRLGGILVGAAAMLMAGHMLKLQWSWTMAGLLLLSAAGTALLLLGLFLVEATMCFFSVKSIEMVNVLTYGGRSACQYPVDIYPNWLRRLFTWVAPFALCMHWPVAQALGHPMTPAPMWMVWLAPLSGAVFFLLMMMIWYRVGVKHYRSTGT